MDAERNRTPLEELRQVVEAGLIENNTGTDSEAPVKATRCLGVCNPGHVMGFADSTAGVYIFNAMDNPNSVKDLVETFNEGNKRSDYSLSPALNQKLEARLEPGVIEKIPWHEGS